MEKMNFQFASKAVEFSEYKNYYEIVDRVCYLSEPNLNGVTLPNDDNSLDKAKTLVDMPVQAKYTIDQDGKPNLLDHCVTVDEYGNYSFNTVSVGVHTDVWIANDDVVTVDGRAMNLPCIFAKAKIWKRYPNYCAAIKRLYEEDNLSNSWEISSFSYEYENGIKTLKDYVFEGNALLGGSVTPAYKGTSKVLEISTEDKQIELLVASALSADLIAGDTNASTTREGDKMSKGKETITKKIADDPISDNQPIKSQNEKTTTIKNEEPKSESSTLTVDDLWSKINKACRKKLNDWGYIGFWFPSENTVWYRAENAESELDFQKFTYEVENDEVTVGEPTSVKLTVSVASVNDAISEKNEALISANSKIEELNSQIGELNSFKEAYEQAQAEKAKAEKEAKIERMRKDAIDANCFSTEELESDEMESVFSAADESALKILIADKILEKLRNEQPVVPTGETATVKADLTNDDSNVDYVKAFKQFLNK